MDLKYQKIQKLPQPLPPSRDGVPAKPNVTRLKPISSGKGKNDDEDFWKVDMKGKNINFL